MLSIQLRRLQPGLPRHPVPEPLGTRTCLALLLCAVLFPVTPALAQRPFLHDDRIVIGGDAHYPPFEWVDDGRAEGFYVDLSEALAKAGGAEVENRLGLWPDAIRALESGKVDAVAMFRSADREKEFLFTEPFFFVNHGIYARAGAPNVSSLHDLEHRRIAVEELSYAHQRLRDSAFPADLVLTANTVDALDAVQAGRADYALLAAPTANYLIRELGLGLRDVGPPLWPRGYAFAVRKDRVALARWLDANMAAILKNGTFASVYDRWRSRLEPSAEHQLSRGLELALLPLAVLALFGLAWACKLRRSVRAGTDVLESESRRRLAAESRVRWATDHDAYTDLPRLHHFAAAVQTALDEGSAEATAPVLVVAIRLADLDRTLRTLGHEAALAASREFAARLRSMPFAACGQSRDVFFAFGDKQTIEAQLGRGQAGIDTLVLAGGAPLQVYCGSALWPADGGRADELLRRAEAALSVAVVRREPWVEYRSSLEPDEADLELLEQFRQTRGAGLQAAFQPQFDLRTGRIVGAEALARWTPAGFGPVPPGRFIPLLEDAGLIRWVTKRMIGEARRVADVIRDAGFVCPISVNVCVSDLLDATTRGHVFGLLRAHELGNADIKLELTETEVADKPEAIGLVIEQLKTQGIPVSIDDFGTGYSTLSHLSNFAVQEVKIDRSFVARMTRRSQDRSIVRSTIAMAHDLGLIVVAEGIETDIQAELLRQDGCDRAQGFLYAKPMSEADFLACLRAQDETRERASSALA